MPVVFPIPGIALTIHLDIRLLLIIQVRHDHLSPIRALLTAPDFGFSIFFIKNLLRHIQLRIDSKLRLALLIHGDGVVALERPAPALLAAFDHLVAAGDAVEGHDYFAAFVFYFEFCHVAQLDLLSPLRLIIYPDISSRLFDLSKQL